MSRPWMTALMLALLVFMVFVWWVGMVVVLCWCIWLVVR